MKSLKNVSKLVMIVATTLMCSTLVPGGNAFAEAGGSNASDATVMQPGQTITNAVSSCDQVEINYLLTCGIDWYEIQLTAGDSITFTGTSLSGSSEPTELFFGQSADSTQSQIFPSLTGESNFATGGGVEKSVNVTGEYFVVVAAYEEDTYSFTATVTHHIYSYLQKSITLTKGKLTQVTGTVLYPDQTPVVTSSGAPTAFLQAFYSSPSYVPAQWHNISSTSISSGTARFSIKPLATWSTSNVRIRMSVSGQGFSTSVSNVVISKLRK